MMINLFGYSTNDFVLFKFQMLIKILVQSLTSSKKLKVKFEANTCWFKSSNIKNTSRTQEGVYLERIKVDRVKTKKMILRRKL